MRITESKLKKTLEELHEFYRKMKNYDALPAIELIYLQCFGGAEMVNLHPYDVLLGADGEKSGGIVGCDCKADYIDINKPPAGFIG